MLRPSAANGGGPLLDPGFAQMPLVVQNLFFTNTLPVLDAWKASKVKLLHPEFFVRLLPSEKKMKKPSASLPWRPVGEGKHGDAQ